MSKNIRNLYYLNGSGSGSIGPTGPTGPSNGPVGPQGPTGIQGQIGPTGLKGDVGSQGPTGSINLRGATKATGVAGIQGIQGVIGPTGARGAIGSSGLVGIQELTGPTGARITTPNPTTLNAIATWGNTTGSSLLNNGVTISSNIMTFPNGGIILPILGGSASILNFYQEYSGTFPSSFPVGIGSITIKIVRIGKVIVLTIDPKTFSISSPTTQISYASIVPTQFRPTTNTMISTDFYSNGVWDTGVVGNVVVSGAGSIIFYRNLDGSGTNFENSCGWQYSLVFCYTVL